MTTTYSRLSTSAKCLRGFAVLATRAGTRTTYFGRYRDHHFYFLLWEDDGSQLLPEGEGETPVLLVENAPAPLGVEHGLAVEDYGGYRVEGNRACRHAFPQPNVSIFFERFRRPGGKVGNLGTFEFRAVHGLGDGLLFSWFKDGGVEIALRGGAAVAEARGVVPPGDKGCHLALCIHDNIYSVVVNGETVLAYLDEFSSIDPEEDAPAYKRAAGSPLSATGALDHAFGNFARYRSLTALACEPTPEVQALLRDLEAAAP